MKKMLCAALLVLAYSVSAWAYPVAVGDQVTMWSKDTAATYEGYYQYQLGANQPYNKLTAYGAFCVEKNEYFNPGATYSVKSIEDVARNGGVGGATNNADPLSNETKWLFYHFLQRDFSSVIGTEENDFALQNAIWYLENEITSISGLARTYVIAAQKAVLDPTVYLGDVKVMNLVSYDKNNNEIFNQSQLVGAPVPEPSTFLLLGAGLLGAGLYRRRMKK